MLLYIHRNKDRATNMHIIGILIVGFFIYALFSSLGPGGFVKLVLWLVGGAAALCIVVVLLVWPWKDSKTKYGVLPGRTVTESQPTTDWAQYHDSANAKLTNNKEEIDDYSGFTEVVDIPPKAYCRDTFLTEYIRWYHGYSGKTRFVIEVSMINDMVKAVKIISEESFPVMSTTQVGLMRDEIEAQVARWDCKGTGSIQLKYTFTL